VQFLEIVKKPKSNRKATEKKTEKPSKPTLSMFFFVFCFLFCSFAVIEKCIEKTGEWHAKIVPRGGVGLGVGFWSKPKNRKKFQQVLDFQRFDAFR